MTKEQLTDIVQWDVKSWNKALQFWESNADWSKVETCLELGGNQGGLSLWLALKGRKTICSDLQGVQEKAEKLHNKHQVAQLVQYQDIDATQIPYENHFDVVVFKSIIGGIGRDNRLDVQQQVFDQIYKALKPGGQLLFAENLVGSSFHQKFRKKFVTWGNSWRYVTLAETQQFLQKFSHTKLKTTGVLATFGRSETQRNWLAGLDNMLLNKVTPRHWKYIVYGVAVK